MKKAFLAGILALFFLLPVSASAGGGWVDLNSQVVSLYRSGAYEKALPLAQEALNLAESDYGTDHPYFATSLNNLASLYQTLGRFEEAGRLHRQALAVDLNLFGEGDSRVAVDRNNLQQLNTLMRSALPPTGAEPEKLEQPEQPEPTEPREYPQWDFGPAKEESENRWGERHKFFGWEAEGSLRNGYRRDHLRWSIAGNKSGNNPDILSELTWDNLRSYTLNGHALLSRESLIALRGSVEYGWIFGGENQDSDYLGNNRTFEFSRSNNTSDRGQLIDVSGGVGYPWTPESVQYDYDFRLIPLAGYSYYQQNLTITNGVQTIPNSGSFAGLDSRYRAEWRGPWLGFDMDFKPYEKIWAYAGFEYHWASYLGNARWNLRDDFSQPKSFRHIADGWGVVGTLGMTYRLSDKWLIDGNAKFQTWTTDPGIDRTFFSDGTVGETRFRQAQWDSYTLSLGAHYRF